MNDLNLAYRVCPSPNVSLDGSISFESRTQSINIVRGVLHSHIYPFAKLNTQSRYILANCFTPSDFPRHVARLPGFRCHDESSPLLRRREGSNSLCQRLLNLLRKEIAIGDQVCDGFRRNHRRALYRLNVIPVVDAFYVGGRNKRGCSEVDFLNKKIVDRHLRKDSHLGSTRLARKPNRKHTHEQSRNDRSARCYGRPSRPIDHAGLAQPPALTDSIQHTHSLIPLWLGWHSPTGMILEVPDHV